MYAAVQHYGTNDSLGMMRLIVSRGSVVHQKLFWVELIACFSMVFEFKQIYFDSSGSRRMFDFFHSSVAIRFVLQFARSF